MAFALPGARTFGEVPLEAVLAAARQLGLPDPAARRIVNEVTVRVAREIAAIVAEHEQVTRNPPPNRASCTGVEARLLKVIEHITLREMLERLAGDNDLGRSTTTIVTG